MSKKRRHLAGAAARRLLIAIMLVAVGVGVWSTDRRSDGMDAAIAVAAGSARGGNVLLLTLDTVRADALECYGRDGISTPVLDALAARGTRFVNATAATPMTLPSHTTILTGLVPPRHGVRENGLFRLTDAHDTLAERLKEDGYATGAFVGSFVLDRRYGLAQGFDTYDDDLHDSGRVSGVRYGEPQRPANVVVDSALDWLNAQQSRDSDVPFFCWVHLYDAHTPYLPPEPYASRYREHLYLGEIAFVDEQVGRLVNWLDAQSLVGKTLVVVVGDHGESLGEHGEETHSLFIYEATVSIPMIWSQPGLVPADVVTDRVTSIADVAPTVLDLLGLDIGANVDGVSLRRGGVIADRAVYIETMMPRLRHGWSPLFGLRRLTDKYIEAPMPEYYDLVRDPVELHNLYGSNATAEELGERLADRMASYEPIDRTGDAAITPDAEALKKLESLGYMVSSGGAAPTAEPGDPKVMVHLYHKYQRAVDLLAVGGFAEAVRLLREVVERSPTDGAAWVSLGLALARAGGTDEALPAITRAISLQPRERHWVYLARLQLTRGDDAGFEASLERLEELDADDGEVAILRGEREMHRKRYAAAIVHFEEARRRDPNRQSTLAHAWTGRALVMSGDHANARRAFEAALTCDPTDTDALEGMLGLDEASGEFTAAVRHAIKLCDRRPLVMRHATKLAELWMRLGNAERAVEALEAMAARRPMDRKPPANLGKLLIDLDRIDEGVASLRRAIALSPAYPFARVQLGRALVARGDSEGAIDQFRQVLSRRPDHRGAWEHLLGALSASGRIDEAFEVLERGGRDHVDFSALARDPRMRALVEDPRFAAMRNQGE